MSYLYYPYYSRYSFHHAALPLSQQKVHQEDLDWKEAELAASRVATEVALRRSRVEAEIAT